MSRMIVRAVSQARHAGTRHPCVGPAVILAALGAAACGGSHGSQNGTERRATSDTASACGTAGLAVPSGFCVTAFADSLGHARHVVVAPSGDVYVNTRAGDKDEHTPSGGLVVALRDSTHDGRADKVVRFGPRAESGDRGGTGIALHNGYLYVENGAQILRYKLRPGELVPDTTAEVVVRGMPETGDHTMHPFIIDSSGALFVDMGSASNSCQLQNRTLNSRGHDPCTELQTRGGIWRYDANRTGQVFSPAARYATGLRNSEGYAINPTDGKLYATQHGRDQLSANFPKFYTDSQSAELPAEEVVQVTAGGNYGWPYCYFDGIQGKLMLAPEYGGDGKTVGRCAAMRAPVAWFPAHWAPDDLLFYRGTQFPASYRGGAFIAFHGSWNRAPLPQGGYNVTFVPWSAHPDSTHVVFATGFAGAVTQPDRAEHRPVGLAEGPDGALFVTDDRVGRVYRITYSGPATSR